MKITPLDIQQQQFRVRFRGFDMVEVDNFLDAVSSELEELLKENNQLREEDRRKMSRIQECEAAEKDLRNTFVSAQKFSEEIKNNAQKEGELIIEKAKGNARKIVDDAHAQALQIEEEINHLKRLRGQFESALKATVEMYRQLLESPPASMAGPSLEENQ